MNTSKSFDYYRAAEGRRDIRQRAVREINPDLATLIGYAIFGDAMADAYQVAKHLNEKSDEVFLRETEDL